MQGCKTPSLLPTPHPQLQARGLNSADVRCQCPGAGTEAMWVRVRAGHFRLLAESRGHPPTVGGLVYIILYKTPLYVAYISRRIVLRPKRHIPMQNNRAHSSYLSHLYKSSCKVIQAQYPNWWRTPAKTTYIRSVRQAHATGCPGRYREAAGLGEAGQIQGHIPQ